jgi:hypothetical protein
MGHGLLEFCNEIVHGEAQGPLFHVQNNPRKVLRGLDIHVLVIAIVGELGPERDIQRQGRIKGLFHINVGHNRHGGGQQVSGYGHNGPLLYKQSCSHTGMALKSFSGVEY